MLGEPKALVRRKEAPAWPVAGLGAAGECLGPDPLPSQLLGELMNKTSHLTEHVSSQPQHFKVSSSPLKRYCKSNHLNERYIIYKFRYY